MSTGENVTSIDEMVFQDENLQFSSRTRRTPLPAPLEAARAMEFGGQGLDSRALFLKQARFLADYEDDQEYLGDPVRYYPTYQSLTDAELRGYFTWRARVRRGQIAETCPTFVFLHVYEILNNIGVDSPQAGYEKLLELRRSYSHLYYRLPFYLDLWLTDYVVYYNLDTTLLEESPRMVNNQCISVIERIESEPRDKVLAAIRQLTPKWLRRSKFYADFYEDMDEIIYRVFRQMTAHYLKGYKRNFVEQFFGKTFSDHVHIFSYAIFCNPLQRKNYEYYLDSQTYYKCENGIWSINMRYATPRGLRKLENLLKSIDSVMRELYNYGHPVKCESETKWVINLIRETVADFLAEKAASEKKKLSIDYSRLDRIRADAAETRDRLIVEEEAEPAIDQSIQVGPAPAGANPVSPALLDQEELRLVRCLLYGEKLDWIRAGGHLLSVLVDGVNEKLYEIFEDSVLDDSPGVIGEYVEDMKEMFPL